MAKLFLSYSRKDAQRAERLVQWLERKGHEVWRDEDDIGGGASFSSEIENALNESDAVVVLWSAHSIQSAWVRDEAGIGRDSGKLIPLSLDGTEAPLGFRQFQAIDLSKWTGRGAPTGGDRINDSIARVAGRRAVAPAIATAASSPRTMSRRPLLVGGALGVVALVAVAGVYAWRSSRAGYGFTIAVVASPNSPDRAAAANYANVTAADLASFVPMHSDRVSVISPANSSNAKDDYQIAIAAGGQGKSADASVTLTDSSGNHILWSKNWDASNASLADLRQSISLAASHAALCLIQARAGAQQLEEPALGNYMNGCTGVSEPDRSNADVDRFFSRVTEAAPNFVPAWADLALLRAGDAGIPATAGPDAKPDPALRERAQEAIGETLKLDPHNGKAYLAQAFMLWPPDSLRGLALVQKAAALQPDDTLIQATLSGSLRNVGRMDDAVSAAERAVQLDPFSPYSEITYIVALTADHQFDRMETEIGKVRNAWGKSKIADTEQFFYDLFYGDARQAQALLPSLDLDSGNGTLPSLIAARIDPTPANISAALNAYSSRSATSSLARIQYLGVLAFFGKTDEAFQQLSDRSLQRALSWDLLFSPRFASLRRDPRFMKLAAELGLAHYWRTTGKWPDFCIKEQLAYDCKKEAAKYG